MCESVGLSVMSDSLRPHGLYPPGSAVHGILQTRILEWVSISFSRGSSRSRDRTLVSDIAGRFFYCLSTRVSEQYFFLPFMNYFSNFILFLLSGIKDKYFSLHITICQKSSWIVWVPQGKFCYKIY